jgi:hypothetical protein
MSFGTERYTLWRKNRLNFIVDELKLDFSGSSVLELGAGRGDLGKMIYDNSGILRTAEPPEYDQSLTQTGVRPSRAWIENIFSKNNFKYTLFTSSLLNSETHIYDWKEENRKEVRSGHRRFWLIEK